MWVQVPPSVVKSYVKNDCTLFTEFRARITEICMKGRRKRGQPPAYLEHKASGLAYATVNGRPKYFGKYGTAESRKRFARFLKDWERDHGREIVALAKTKGGMQAHVAAYLDELRGDISDIEHYAIDLNLKTLVEHFNHLDPDEFRAAELKELRKVWIDAGHVRKTINKQVGRVKRFFEWMVSEERCEFETWAILNAVRPIGAGKMPDNPEVEPVPIEDLEATLPFLDETSRTIILVIQLGGPRPSEACRMKGHELFRDGFVKIGRRHFKIPDGLWVFMPTKKKQNRPVAHVFGPKLQEALKPFLRDDPDEPMFTNKKGEPFTRHFLIRRTTRAAKKAKVPHWFPHQVRHLFVTRTDEASDLVTASEGAGHAGIDTTLIYLQRKIQSVAEVARKIG